MALTQESFMSLLIAEGGKVKKSELVGKFKGSIESEDPAEKERNKEVFKTIVNKVAYVKEIDGVRYVVLKKMYQHVIEEGVRSQTAAVETEHEEIRLTGDQQRPPVRREEAEGAREEGGGERSAVSEPDQELSSESIEDPTEQLSLVQLALQRNKFQSIRLKRMLRFDSQKQYTNGDNSQKSSETNEPTVAKSKPFALPLRVPPSATRVEVRKLKADPDEDPPQSPKPDYLGNKRGPSLVETLGGNITSPQPRRALKSTKSSEEHKESSGPSSTSLIPLEQSEHEWLVKCAAGHWTHVLGLLLRDNQLADKRDFTSGFTALHWAAKCGNCEMLVKIMDLSKQGSGVDVNTRTHGGYTPLHIAALHGQEHAIAMLVNEQGADPRVRDNYGKRAYHYLQEGASESVREMLGQPKARDKAHQDNTREKEEQLSDLFTDLPKGLQSISRLFQPHHNAMTGQKKKHKLRPALYSLTSINDPNEEREETGFRRRLVSDAFM